MCVFICIATLLLAPGSAAHRYDYALVELKAKVPLTDYVNVACLPDGPTPIGSKCVAAGWGVSDSGGTLRFKLKLDTS